jgi:hypothetical protein
LEISRAGASSSGSDNSPKATSCNLATPGDGQKLWLLAVCAKDASGTDSYADLDSDTGILLEQFKTDDSTGYSIIDVREDYWGDTRTCRYYHNNNGINVGVECWNIISDERADLTQYFDYGAVFGSNPDISVPPGGAVFASCWSDGSSAGSLGSFVNEYSRNDSIDEDYWASGAEAYATGATGNPGLSSPSHVSIMSFGPGGAF